jgi:inhibitor of KinA
MEFHVRAAGDSGWLVELPDRLDIDVNARAIEIAKAIEQSDLPATDVVVGYRSVMVYVDPLSEQSPGIARRLEGIAASAATIPAASAELVVVPVCYDGVHGPDLADIAAFAQCSVPEVIERHLAIEYRVFVVGFVPGFAYMAPVDPRIAAPRRPAPRLKVPAGSVAIAAGQTGIYPAETPGGWSLIGRSPVRPYDPQRDQPFLFRPGDRVRFDRISAEQYARTSEWGDV